MSVRLGIDTGGTFSDFVAVDSRTGEVRTAKVASTPTEPARAIAAGLAELGRARRRAGRGRHDGRDERGDPASRRPRRLPDERGVHGRPVHRPHRQGTPLRPALGEAGAARVAQRLLRRRRAGSTDTANGSSRSTANGCRRSSRRSRRSTTTSRWPSAVSSRISDPTTSRRSRMRVRDALPSVSVSVSHEVSPVWREHERASTTIADAFVKPIVERLRGRRRRGVPPGRRRAAGTCSSSNGGYLPAGAARERPVQLLLSGLAGGVVGARYFAERAGYASVFSLDMGGTSCDIGLVLDGRAAVRERVPGRVGDPGQHPLRRGDDDRRRRRLDLLARQGRLPARRAAERRRRAGPGRIRQGRNRADHDRREPRARPPRPGLLPRRPDADRRGRRARRLRGARRRAGPLGRGRGSGGRPDRGREHGERDPPRRGRARPRPARLRADRVRRGRPAPRPRGGRPARDDDGADPAAPGALLGVRGCDRPAAGRSRADVLRPLRPPGRRGARPHRADAARGGGRRRCGARRRPTEPLLDRAADRCATRARTTSSRSRCRPATSTRATGKSCCGGSRRSTSGSTASPCRGRRSSSSTCA